MPGMHAEAERCARRLASSSAPLLCCYAITSPGGAASLPATRGTPGSARRGGNKDNPETLGAPLAIGPKERRERSGDAKADTSAGGGDKTHMEREGGGGRKKEGGCISTSTQKEPWADLRGPATGCWARTRFPTLADVSPPLFGSDSSHFRLHTAVCVCAGKCQTHSPCFLTAIWMSGVRFNKFNFKMGYF